MNATIVRREEPRAAIMEVLRHPTVQFMQALDHLKEEHELLRGKLNEFPCIEECIRHGKKDTNWYGTLLDVRSRVECLLALLEQHAEWESRVLFPTVALYAEERPEAFGMLEEDHQHALQYMRSFSKELSAMSSPIYKADAIRLMSMLMKAHLLLTKHLNAEDQWVYPIADEVLEDIDYLSC